MSRRSSLAMNQAVYDGLSDDLKAVLDKQTGAAFSAQPGAVTQAQEWQDAAQPVIDAWIAGAGAAGLDGQALVDGGRSAVEAGSN